MASSRALRLTYELGFQVDETPNEVGAQQRLCRGAETNARGDQQGLEHRHRIAGPHVR
jgi:hypothetical protein